MNKTVIAEFGNSTRPVVVDPIGWLRDVPVMAASLARTIIDRVDRLPRFSHALACPKCGSCDARGSRAKSVLEAGRRQLTDMSPYRCGKCGYRGWGPDDFRRRQNASASFGQTASQAGPVYFTEVATIARGEQLDFQALNIPQR